eukprot:scaffold5546_cov247-Pinguiococcus_pyrenoidosus.AAC.5
MNADSATNAAGVEYFRQNKDAIRAAMKKHGCVWLRGFELMQDVKGYRQMWEALGLLPCLDPIHSSGLRKFASERDGCYEEVNKPSLRGHYIGLHQESTAKRTAAAAAFVCFKRATEEGGRFTIADGAEILADMKTDTLERLYEDGVRISVSNLDTPFTQEEGVVGAVRGAFKGLVQTAVAPKFDMDLEMIWEADGKPGRLQAVEDCEPPINRHPETGVPVWFCNAHNHLRYLRDRRPCGVPEVGMTDVFRGPSLEKISDEDADEIKRVSEKNIVALPMEPGDVLLIDNYRALHGRETFKGDRFHAVTWFSWDNPEWRVGAEEGSDDSKDVMNKIHESQSRGEGRREDRLGEHARHPDRDGRCERLEDVVRVFHSPSHQKAPDGLREHDGPHDGRPPRVGRGVHDARELAPSRDLGHRANRREEIQLQLSDPQRVLIRPLHDPLKVDVCEAAERRGSQHGRGPEGKTNNGARIRRRLACVALFFPRGRSRPHRPHLTLGHLHGADSGSQEQQANPLPLQERPLQQRHEEERREERLGLREELIDCGTQIRQRDEVQDVLRAVARGRDAELQQRPGVYSSAERGAHFLQPSAKEHDGEDDQRP